MSQDDVRAQVRCASLEIDRLEVKLATRWQVWRERLDRYRLPALIGGGVLSGLALATISPRRWSRAGAALFGSGAWLARSPAGPALLAALWTSILSSPRQPSARPTASGDTATPGA